MRHIEKAHLALSEDQRKFITIENAEDTKGVSPVVKITLQSDPVSEVGVNGVQGNDVMDLLVNLYESLDEKIPCQENEMTVKHLKQAIQWQNIRTLRRKEAKVEGTMNPIPANRSSKNPNPVTPVAQKVVDKSEGTK